MRSARREATRSFVFPSAVLGACTLALLVGCSTAKKSTSADLGLSGSPTQIEPMTTAGGRAALPKQAVSSHSSPALSQQLAGKSADDNLASTQKDRKKKSWAFWSKDSSKKDEEAADAEKDAAGQFAMARLLERRGQDKGAAKLFRSLVDADPNHARARHRLGVVLARQGKLDEAETQLSTASKLAPDDIEIRSDLGYVYYLQHDLEKADAVLRSVLREVPNHKAACNNLALVLGGQGKFEECLRMFRRTNSEAESHANLAYALAQQGRLAEAEKAYLRALSLDDSLKEAAKAMLQVARRRQAVTSTQVAGSEPRLPGRRARAMQTGHDDADVVPLPPTRELSRATNERPNRPSRPVGRPSAQPHGQLTQQLTHFNPAQRQITEQRAPGGARFQQAPMPVASSMAASTATNQTSAAGPAAWTMAPNNGGYALPARQTAAAGHYPGPRAPRSVAPASYESVASDLPYHAAQPIAR